MYDSNGNAGIKGCRAQRETECVRYKGLETSFFTDLDQSVAAVTTDLVGDKTHHTHTWMYQHCLIFKQAHKNINTQLNQKLKLT